MSHPQSLLAQFDRLWIGKNWTARRYFKTLNGRIRSVDVTLAGFTACTNCTIDGGNSYKWAAHPAINTTVNCPILYSGGVLWGQDNVDDFLVFQSASLGAIHKELFSGTVCGGAPYDTEIEDVFLTLYTGWLAAANETSLSADIASDSPLVPSFRGGYASPAEYFALAPISAQVCADGLPWDTTGATMTVTPVFA